MNFKKAIELLDVVSNFQFRKSEKKPDFCLIDNQHEGYTLCVREDKINPEYRNYLEEIAKSRKLGIRESDGYLTIYEP